MRAETPQKHAPAWMVWTALWIVYIVWGSTYLAIRISVETLPPFLAGGVRFLIAGSIMYVFLLFRGGRARVKITKDQLIGSGLVGTALLLGGNGIVMLAEQHVASGLASLLIATVPLWVILFRALAGEKVPGGTLWGVLMGFAGVALLVLPGDKPEHAPIGGMLLLLLAAFFWASGTFSSRRLSLPSDPLVSTAWQMLLGGVALLIAAAIRGEFGSVQVEEFSTRSIVALTYLIFIGSLVAFTAYVWLLQHAPVSKVATYAYVNPVIAVFLGWLVLSEQLTVFMLAGAAVIVSSVAFIVRKEAEVEEPVHEELGPVAAVPADA